MPHKRYENNKYDPEYVSRQIDNSKINRATAMAIRERPCMDCGLRLHPSVMTFDHRDRSTKNVSDNGKRLSPMHMLSYPPRAFNDMLANCDCVCLNCHKIREMRRDNVLTADYIKKYYDKIGRGALLR